jgi:signal transduction histidine kinase
MEHVNMALNNGETAASLQPFLNRLTREAEKISRSRFSHLHNDLLKAFCNVVQAESSLDYFFKICASVPAALGDLHGALYLLNKKNGQLQCVCDSQQGIIDPPHAAPEYIVQADKTYKAGGAMLYPLFPVPPVEDTDTQVNVIADKKESSPFTHDLLHPDPFFTGNSLLGMFAVYPLADLSRQDQLFFSMLTNWIGYKLNNRLIAVQHLEHLRFLNSLGRDMGHNVIVPNMYFKYLLRKLEKKIDQIDQISWEAAGQTGTDSRMDQCQQMFADCAAVKNDLQSCHQELVKHHTQISLFLESLFRVEHFTLGHLVVRPQKCLVEKDIVIPQLEMYAGRLADQGITIDKPRNMTGQEFPLMVDIGLLSQVYANLFSNAVKYTREIEHNGRKRKAVAYGCEEVGDFPEPGRKGIKFNVFTTGPPLNDQERTIIFQEGVRGENSAGIAGLGHGLAFIQRVIDVHGGKVGCEATEEGNNFYFILPLSDLTDS